MWVQSLGREDLLEEGMATHSSILAWRIPWTEEHPRTEEPGGLQFTGLQKVGRNGSDLACTVDGHLGYFHFFVVVVAIKSSVKQNFLFMFSVAHMQEFFQRSCSQSMVSASDHLGTCQKSTILTSPPDPLNKKCWERAPVISFNKPSQMC